MINPIVQDFNLSYLIIIKLMIKLFILIFEYDYVYSIVLL